MPTPATPAQIADPSVDRDGLTHDERAAVARRRLSSSEWVMIVTFCVTALFMMGAVHANRSPAHALERERQAVREAVFRAQLVEVRDRVSASGGTLCLALFGSIDPPAELLGAFADEPFEVAAVSECRRGATRAHGGEAWLLSVSSIDWASSQRARVMAGVDSLVQYTLERQRDEWRVVDSRTIWPR